jgi:Domain of unknown function (DUF5658)
VIGRAVAILVGESLDIVALAGIAFGRAASIGFLRLATLFLAQALDLATFSLMVARHGGMAEANPIVNNIFETYGMSAAVLAKLALVVLIGALSAAAWSRGNRGVWSMVGGLPLALAIAAGLIGAITNTATLLR